MTRGYITARRPPDVAREVEQLAGRGCRSFVIVRVSGGGTLDLERLGAARYVAGLQAEVVLEDASFAGASVPEAAAR
jgi:hypothetical protein